MRGRRLRLAGLVCAIALAGPWTSAHADNWPFPDPAAGHGVIVGDMAFHSATGVALRLTLKKAGEVDVLWWADFGPHTTVPSKEGIANGGVMWNVRTPNSPTFSAYGDLWSATSDFYVNGNGTTVVDSRGAAPTPGAGDMVGMGDVPAGTYDLVLWTASNVSHIDARYRVHAPKGSKLHRLSVSTRTFRLDQRDFAGTASVDAEYGAGGTAIVGESAHITVRNKFFGAYRMPAVFGVPTGFGSYSGPTGTHQLQGVDAVFAGTPAGGYTFTVNASAGDEPLVTGIDIGVP